MSVGQPASTTIAALVALLALPFAADAGVPAGVANWQNIDPAGHAATLLQANRPFVLKSVANNSPIGYGKRTWGPDLTWNGSGKWTFIAAGKPTKAITTADNLALYNSATKMYLSHAPQSYGVNLRFVSSPTYDWQ